MPDGMPNITARFDVSAEGAGRTDWTVSQQWATRPDDQRYRSLDEMIAILQRRTGASTSRTLKLGDVRPRLTSSGGVGFDFDGLVSEATNYGFQHLMAQVNMPTAFLTGPLHDAPDLVVRCMEHAWGRSDVDLSREIATLETSTGEGNLLRAVTSPTYGRIWDLTLVEAIKKITEESGARWEVPTAFHQPGQELRCEEVTKEDTTLYASDRDVFVFMVDQRNPIEAGKLPNGDPDLYFRGFYAWNGECGGKSNGVSTFLYRWVCRNRSIREQKGWQSVRLAHTAGAGQRFVSQLMPALQSFCEGSTAGIADGLMQANRTKVARTDEDRVRFLTAQGFGPLETATILQRIFDEEGHPLETVGDAVQGITAMARSIKFTDQRVALERRAGQLLDKAAAL